MSRKKDCIERVLAAMGEAGKKILAQKGRLKNLKKRLYRVAQKYSDDPAAAVTDTALQRKILETIEDLQIEERIKRNNMVRNAHARMTTLNYVLKHWDDKPDEGLIATVVGSNLARVGSKDSVAQRVYAMQHMILARFYRRMDDLNLRDVAKSRDFDADVFRALWYMSSKNEAKLAEIPPTTRKLAELYREFQDFSRNLANRHGAWIGEGETFAINRVHESRAIETAGGSHIPVSDPIHRAAWKQFVLPKLDRTKTFADATEAEVDGILDRMFNSFVAGQHVFSRNKADPGSVVAGVGGGNKGARLSHTRVLHFLSPEDEWAYVQRFGGEHSLLGMMHAALESRARDIAIMEKLGPNAEMNLRKVFEALKRKHGDELGGGQVVKKLQKAENKIFNRWMPYITGEANKPENAWWAKRMSEFRAWISTTALGGAGIALFGDTPMRSNAINYYSERTLSNFVSELGPGIANFVRAWTGDIVADVSGNPVYGPKALQLLSELAVNAETNANVLGPLGYDAFQQTGLASWLQTKTMQFNRVAAATYRTKASAAMTISHGLGNRVGKTLDELEPGYRDFLTFGNITKEEWDIMRTAETFVDDEGRKYITIDTVRNLSNAKMLDHPEVQGYAKELFEQHQKMLEKVEKAREREVEWYTKFETKMADLKLRLRRTLSEAEVRVGAREGAAFDLRLKQQEKLKIRLEQVENELGIKAFLEQEEIRSGLREALDDLEDSRAIRDGEEAGKARRSAKGKANRAFTKQGRTQSRLGQELARKQVKLTEQMKKIDEEMAALEEAAREELDEAAKGFQRDLKTIDEEAASRLKGATERMQKRQEFVDTFEKEIGSRVQKKAAQVRDGWSTRTAAMYTDLMTMAANEPGVKQRYFLTFGGNPGSFAGELGRMLTMYKSYPLTVLDKNISRLMHGFDDNGRIGESSMMAMAGLVAGSLVFGYLTLALKELSRGRTPVGGIPRGFNDFWKTATKSAFQSGALGLYGDFLFSDYSRFGRDPVTEAAGPGAAVISDLMKIWSNAILNPDAEDAGKRAARLALRYTPLVGQIQNYALTRWLFDLGIGYKLDEILSPQSGRRAERRLRRDTNQGFIGPTPTEAARWWR